MAVFTQFLGLLGMAFNLSSYQLKEQKKLIGLQFFAGIMFTLHYLLLGAPMGCVLNAVGIFRAYVFSHKEQAWAQKKGWLPFFNCASLVIYLLTFTVFGKERTVFTLFLELLPVIGSIATNIGFSLESAAKVRRLSLISSPAWLVYNILSGSIGGCLTEIFCLTSVIVGIIRLDRIKKDN